MYLSLCIVSIEQDRTDTFGRLLALMKKHHMLAFLSVLRLHHVQALMNLRQVLEAGGSAAYAIANPAVEDFVDIDAFGIMDPSAKLLKKRYDWLKEKYAPKSEWLKETKDKINSLSTHANIISGARTFRIKDDGTTASTLFFDFEDKEYVKIDLWLISNAAVALMDLFYGVAADVAPASRWVIEFRHDFSQVIQGLAAESNTLLDEIKGSDRFKAAMERQAQRIVID
jgi:hypothetical protein